MNPINLINAFFALATLASVVPPLASEVTTFATDKTLEAAIKSTPLLAARLPKISQEWRAVENDVENASKDKNLLSKLGAVEALLKDAGLLEHDVANGQADAALVAEIKANPVILAHLSLIASEWTAVQSALKAL